MVINYTTINKTNEKMQFQGPDIVIYVYFIFYVILFIYLFLINITTIEVQSPHQNCSADTRRSTWSTCQSYEMLTKYNILWSPILQIWFTVNLPLFFLSNQGLGASSPAELPYPPQASVFWSQAA